jgi:hypothetical protein
VAVKAGSTHKDPTAPFQLPRISFFHPPPLEPLRSCIYRFKATLEASEGVSMGHFREGRPSLLSAFGTFLSGGQRQGEGPQAAAQRAEVFIAINASTVELADLGAPFREHFYS